MCRSRCGLTGSIHSTRMIAPHVGQPGRSNTLGTESVSTGSIRIKGKLPDPAMQEGKKKLSVLSRHSRDTHRKRVLGAYGSSASGILTGRIVQNHGRPCGACGDMRVRPTHQSVSDTSKSCGPQSTAPSRFLFGCLRTSVVIGILRILKYTDV